MKIWQNARILTTNEYTDFNIHDYGFKNQIQNASVSIMNNISEGFWRGTDAEFKQFLVFARGSVGEVKNMYYIAEDLEYLAPSQCIERREAAQGLCNGISAFIAYLKKNSGKKMFYF